MLVDSDDVVEYPIDADTRLANQQSMLWRYDWWLKSDFRLLAEKEVRAAVIALVFVGRCFRWVHRLY